MLSRHSVAGQKPLRLSAIRADPEASPFAGEGHRKVWARLRILSGIRVSKDRVCDPKPDKRAILAAIKAGHEVPGARIVRGQRVEIR